MQDSLLPIFYKTCTGIVVLWILIRLPDLFRKPVRRTYRQTAPRGVDLWDTPDLDQFKRYRVSGIGEWFTGAPVLTLQWTDDDMHVHNGICICDPETLRKIRDSNWKRQTVSIYRGDADRMHVEETVTTAV